MQFFDSHAHYNDEKFNQDKDNVLKEIYNQDITRLVCAGYNYQSSVSAIEISQENDCIYTTIGISPNDVEDLSKVDSLE